MDDETVYGPRAYTLTFGSAARQGIICNYKVVISVVDGEEVNDFALKHGITLIQGDLIAGGSLRDVQELAGHTSLSTTQRYIQGDTGKGHTYRIVVSALLRGRPIWFGGK